MITTLISEFMTMISGLDRTLMGLDEFLCVVFSFFRAFWTRFDFLGIRAIEFSDAACAVGCVSELRVRDALNHAKRTSDATGNPIRSETYQKSGLRLRLDVRD